MNTFTRIFESSAFEIIYEQSQDHIINTHADDYWNNEKANATIRQSA